MAAKAKEAVLQLREDEMMDPPIPTTVSRNWVGGLVVWLGLDWCFGLVVWIGGLDWWFGLVVWIGGLVWIDG